MSGKQQQCRGGTRGWCPREGAHEGPRDTMTRGRRAVLCARLGEATCTRLNDALPNSRPPRPYVQTVFKDVIMGWALIQ